MKTTSFEISKMLKKEGISDKIGFLDYYYNTDGELRHRDQETYCSQPENTVVDCFAYDLETILEALPERDDSDFMLAIFSGAKFIGYYKLGKYHHHVYGEKSESLADTAARLLILLHEKGLIKFEVENDE